MMTAQLEALLYTAGRPLSVNMLAQHLHTTVEETETMLTALACKYEEQGSGLCITRINSEVQLATAPSCSPIIQEFLQQEVQSELTRPSLETLTILSYRGPLSKLELENLRGVNCTLILRNLAIKGLVTSETKQGMEYYRVSFEFLTLLGIADISELPDYARLNQKLEAVAVKP